MARSWVGLRFLQFIQVLTQVTAIFSVVVLVTVDNANVITGIVTLNFCLIGFTVSTTSAANVVDITITTHTTKMTEYRTNMASAGMKSYTTKTILRPFYRQHGQVQTNPFRSLGHFLLMIHSSEQTETATLFDSKSINNEIPPTHTADMYKNRKLKGELSRF